MHPQWCSFGPPTCWRGAVTAYFHACHACHSCHASHASHVQLGTLPDWIAAIGTTLAFFVAFTVLALDLKERRRRQAQQVTAWLDRGPAEVTLHVANSSEVPVYKVRVTPQFLGQDYDVVSFPLLGPKTDQTPLRIGVPGGQAVSNEYLGVKMVFADSAGRRWERARDGKLQRRWKNYD
jgi:hypothetical protein